METIRKQIENWLAEHDIHERPLKDTEMAALAEFVARECNWLPLSRFDAVERHYELLYDSGIVTVWLLDWCKEYGPTEYHSHGESRAAVHVCRGEVIEEYWNGSAIVSRTASEGSTLIITAPYIHKVGDNESRATSVHVYSPALHQMEYWKLDKLGIPCYIRIWRENESRREFC